jgi:hypothetical protein
MAYYYNGKTRKGCKQIKATSVVVVVEEEENWGSAANGTKRH